MRKRIKRVLVAGLALAGAAPAEAAAPANTVAVLLQSSGTFAPGLHPTPVGQQTFTLTSVAMTTIGTVHDNTTVLGTSNCAVNGSDGVAPWPGDTLALGTGSGAWGCFAGPLAGKGGSLLYARVATAVTIVLTDYSEPPARPVGALACVFVPNQLPPAAVTSFGSFTCAGTLADVL